MIDSETQDDVGKVANENRILNELVAAKVMTDNATSSFTSLHPDELIAGIIYVTSFSSISYCSYSEYWPFKYSKT